MIDYERTRPIYLQIMEKIKRKVILGELEPGSKLLSMRDMAIKMNVNPNTMYRVYNELENEGIVETRRGMGTYLVEDKTVVERLKNELIDTRILKSVKSLVDSGFTDEEILEYVKEALKRMNRGK